jgi:hypothetical protein
MAAQGRFAEKHNRVKSLIPAAGGNILPSQSPQKTVLTFVRLANEIEAH